MWHQVGLSLFNYSDTCHSLWLVTVCLGHKPTPPVHLAIPWRHPSLLHRFWSVCHPKIPSILRTSENHLGPSPDYIMECRPARALCASGLYILDNIRIMFWSSCISLTSLAPPISFNTLLNCMIFGKIYEHIFWFSLLFSVAYFNAKKNQRDIVINLLRSFSVSFGKRKKISTWKTKRDDITHKKFI